MTLSNPILADATGYLTSTGSSFAMWLWQNSGGYGYARFEFYNTAGDIISRASDCFSPKTGLNYLTTVEITTSPPVNIFNMKAFRCATDSDQACPAGVCVNLVNTGALSNIPVKVADTTIPNSPGNLKITPGDKQLTISWDAVTNTNIFAYYVKVTQSGTLIVDGYLTSRQLTTPIQNLINGTTYDVQVTAVSSSRVYGSPANGSGTPAISASGSISFISNPPGAEIYIDNADQHQVTPFTIAGVPAGVHSYKLRLVNFPDMTGNVTVHANKTVLVSVNFTTGQVNIGLLAVGIGIAAVLIGGLIYVLRKPQTTRMMSGR